MQIEIKCRPCAQSHKDLEAVLKRKDREREGGKGAGVSGLFWGSGPADFEKGILIASVGGR